MRAEQEVQNESKPSQTMLSQRRKEEDDETQLIVVCYPNKL